MKGAQSLPSKYSPYHYSLSCWVQGFMLVAPNYDQSIYMHQQRLRFITPGSIFPVFNCASLINLYPLQPLLFCSPQLYTVIICVSFLAARTSLAIFQWPLLSMRCFCLQDSHSLDVFSLSKLYRLLCSIDCCAVIKILKKTPSGTNEHARIK